MEFEFNKYGPRKLSVETDLYTFGGGHVVDLIDDTGEPYARVSINCGVPLADDEFVFKTYSENDGLIEAMLAAGVVETTGRSVDVGLAGPQPICRLLKPGTQPGNG